VRIPATEGYGETETFVGDNGPAIPVPSAEGLYACGGGDWSPEKQEIEMDVPDVEEARKELFSGKDISGGSWPSPKLPLNVAEWLGRQMSGRVGGK
jgi:hypothetical protein